mmetsp:Transcript_21168/g.48056  ORF Transcript_21168/g.48056 Transcript_21168/m.48056 type:complete len:98 (+) Transcript_21168:339-632(+)
MDILISDNTYYHWGGEAATLEDYLWDEHNVLIVCLPARTPEWNPMELVWGVIVQQLGLMPLGHICSLGTDAVAHAATSVLEKINHDDIVKFYSKCFA